MSTKYTAAQIGSTLFVKDKENPSKHVCCLCNTSITQKVKTGFTNLQNNILGSHFKTFEEKMKDKDLQTKLTYGVSDKIMNIYYWLQWIIVDNLEFNFVDSKFAKQHVNLAPVARPTLMKHFLQLNEEVQQTEVCFYFISIFIYMYITMFIYIGETKTKNQNRT